MRALLIVNPHATSTTRTRRDVIVRALASTVDLEVVETRYRGDATKVAATAAAENYGLVMTLGGDGTVNEVVNGLLTSEGGVPPDAAHLPALAALPGGNANVFTRSLHLPPDPVDAAGQLIEDIVAGRERRIGLGAAVLDRGPTAGNPEASSRYFTFNAGLGLDAEVVRAVESRRTDGRGISPAFFGRMALRQYYRVTDRHTPAIALLEPAEVNDERVYMCIICNSAPWTFIGNHPVNASPRASFDAGLDLLAMRRLKTVSTLRTVRQMLSAKNEPHGRAVLACHDLPVIAVKAERPIALQLDGEYVGEVEEVRFRSVPRALRVVGLGELNST